jgi:hypothetical protein
MLCSIYYTRHCFGAACICWLLVMLSWLVNDADIRAVLHLGLQVVMYTHCWLAHRMAAHLCGLHLSMVMLMSLLSL